MSDLSQQSCVVYDHGHYAELALRLGRELGTVYYATNWEGAMARIDSRCIGEGFEDQNVIRVESVFDVLDKVNFIVFPDCHDAAMQLWFEKQGMPVWGARRADRLELFKLTFKKLLEENKLPVTGYDVLSGIDELVEHLKKNTDRWIKTSPQFRGMTETFHHEDYLSSRPDLAQMLLEYGLMVDQIKFISEKPIKAQLEGGIDTYVVDGEHPGVVSSGFEIKDRCYFLEMKPYAQVDESITRVNNFLWPLLKGHRARQFFSTEVKVTEDGQSFFLEPTIRMPSPPGDELMEVYKNISEIISQGASGVLVEPELAAKYACEAIIEHQGDDCYPRSLSVPDDYRQWIKLKGVAKVGSRYWIAPSKGNRIIGSVIGIGDTPQEALDHCLDNAASIAGQDVAVHIDALVKVLQEIQAAQDEGLEVFENADVPQPAAAIEES